MSGQRPATSSSGTPLGHKNDNQENSPSLQDQILSHISSLETLIKEHNERAGTLITPIRLTFDREVESNKGKDNKGSGEEKDEDLKRLYKEVLKSLFTRRIIEFSAPNHWMHTNLKIYDGSTDPDDHITRFVGKANQGEWEMTVCKDLMEVSKIIRRANETLPDFKERWTEKMSYIQGVLEVMQISAFMSNSNCPELARRFANQLSLDFLTKRPKEILATELQLQLPPCPPMVETQKKESLDKYYDYHGEKGHYTNDCYKLKRQLEAALESEKLSHLRVLYPEKNKVVMKEVEEWVKAGIVRHVRNPTWISNPVMVNKVDSTWRMCIEFKNVNSACLKDYYPLPEIDLNIEASQPQEDKGGGRYAVPKNLERDAKLKGEVSSIEPVPLQICKTSLPFFKTLKNITKEIKDDYQWMEDAER
nr:reverse transcriptase domain-containing protein [Tanacetum cinerariifolium]